jgi:hypothetical protein
MVEWANLKRFVRRVSETAMIDEADGGKHVQTLLLSGKLKARAPLLMKGGSIKPAEEMAIIPPHYWEEINVDWRKLNDPYGYDPDGGNYYEFFVGGEFYLASEIEILSTDARAFLRQLEHEDLPPVLPQAKNRGGRAATINWGGLAGHITAWTIDNGVPETAAPLVKKPRTSLVRKSAVRKMIEPYSTLPQNF